MNCLELSLSKTNLSTEEKATITSSFNRLIDNGLSEVEAQQEAITAYLEEINSHMNNLKTELELSTSDLKKGETEKVESPVYEDIMALEEYKKYTSKKATKNKISQTLSYFLTSYVDIAKDPYITKGNFNAATSNAAMLLVRAGAPLEWIIGYIGQPILKEYALIEGKKESRFNPSKASTFIVLKQKYTNELKKLLGKNSEHILENINNLAEEAGQLGDFVRKDKRFKLDLLEKNIVEGMPDTVSEKIEYLTNQLVYLNAYQAYNSLGRQFNSTVVHSKADVNGAKSNFAENFLYEHKYDKMYKFKSPSDRDSNGNLLPLFINLNKKFNTFLGTKHRNSVELVTKIYSNEIITASPKLRSIFESYMADNPFATKEDLTRIEGSLYGFINSKNGFLNLDNNDIKSLTNTDKLHKKIVELRTKYPNNELLNYLELDRVKDKYFLKMDNFKNKPNTFKDDLIRSWQDLHQKETTFSENLIKYSFVTSNFQFNSNSFFDLIPYNILADIIGPTIDAYKDSYISREEFDSFMYRHNPELAPSIKSETLEGNIIYHKKQDYGNTVISEASNSPYLKHEDILGNITLFERANELGMPFESYTDEEGNEVEKNLYIKKSKLGFKSKGYVVYEHSLPKVSTFKGNNVGFDKTKLANIKGVLDEVYYEHTINTPISTISKFYKDKVSVTPMELANINKAIKTNYSLDEFNDLSEEQKETLIECYGK